MATLTIRDLPDLLHRRLRERAAEKGRSVEAEARLILEESLAHRDRREAWLQAAGAIRAALSAANQGALPNRMVEEFLEQKIRTNAAEIAEVDRYVTGERVSED